jgi:hypothetical protein
MGKGSNGEGTIRRVGFVLEYGRIYSRKHCIPAGWMALFRLAERRLRVHLDLELLELA